MRQCAWADCPNEVYKPQNRRSIWCWTHLAEQVVQDAYRPTEEQVAEAYINEWAIRQEAKMLAMKSLNQWTWKERILSCLTLMFLALAASWGMIAVAVIACRFCLWLLRLVHLA